MKRFLKWSGIVLGGLVAHVAAKKNDSGREVDVEIRIIYYGKH